MQKVKRLPGILSHTVHNCVALCSHRWPPRPTEMRWSGLQRICAFPHSLCHLVSLTTWFFFGLRTAVCYSVSLCQYRLLSSSAHNESWDMFGCLIAWLHLKEPLKWGSCAALFCIGACIVNFMMSSEAHRAAIVLVARPHQSRQIRSAVCFTHSPKIQRLCFSGLSMSYVRLNVLNKLHTLLATVTTDSKQVSYTVTN